MLNIRQRKIKRVRSKIFGTAIRPRLAVFRSNKQVSAQLINDNLGTTIVSATSAEIKDIKIENKAFEVGKILAKKAVAKKITKAVFDRRFYKFHGKIKSVAEGAKKEGLKI